MTDVLASWPLELGFQMKWRHFLCLPLLGPSHWTIASIGKGSAWPEVWVWLVHHECLATRRFFFGMDRLAALLFSSLLTNDSSGLWLLLWPKSRENDKKGPLCQWRAFFVCVCGTGIGTACHSTGEREAQTREKERGAERGLFIWCLHLDALLHVYCGHGVLSKYKRRPSITFDTKKRWWTEGRVTRRTKNFFARPQIGSDSSPFVRTLLLALLSLTLSLSPLPTLSHSLPFWWLMLRYNLEPW